MAAKLSDGIDRMLEQYLQLLDQYTTLRSQLTVAQASVSSSLDFLSLPYCWNI